MQNKKISLIVIIVLLILFLPITIFATTMHYIDRNKEVENKNHDFYSDGKLYFYNKDTLLGKYTCQSTDYCDYAVSRNSSTYSLKEPKVSGSKKQSLIYNRYAILMDTATTNLLDANMILYDVINEEIYANYKEIKNYGVGIENNYYIAQNEEDLWGVLEITDEVKEIIPFQYDYIGLRDIKNAEGKIKSDCFAVYENNTWYLIDSQNNKLSDAFTDSFVNYNDYYVITTNTTQMNLLTYNGINRLFGSYPYLDFWDKYIAVVDNSSNFYLYDLDSNKEVSKRHVLTNIQDLSYKIENDFIRIYFGEELIENVAIK